MMRGISWLSTRRHALLVPALALTLLSLNVRRAVAAEPAVNGSNIDEMIWYTPYGYSKGDGYSGSWPPYYNASTGDYGFKVGSSYSLELYGLANTTWNIYLYHYNNKTRLKWDDYSQLNRKSSWFFCCVTGEQHLCQDHLRWWRYGVFVKRLQPFEQNFLL